MVKVDKLALVIFVALFILITLGATSVLKDNGELTKRVKELESIISKPSLVELEKGARMDLMINDEIITIIFPN